MISHILAGSPNTVKPISLEAGSRNSTFRFLKVLFTREETEGELSMILAGSWRPLVRTGMLNYDR